VEAEELGPALISGVGGSAGVVGRDEEGVDSGGWGVGRLSSFSVQLILFLKVLSLLAGGVAVEDGSEEMSSLDLFTPPLAPPLALGKDASDAVGVVLILRYL